MAPHDFCSKMKTLRKSQMTIKVNRVDPSYLGSITKPNRSLPKDATLSVSAKDKSFTVNFR